MSRGLPSMTALLGLLAVAGYQNRDKLAELLGGGARVNPERSEPDRQDNPLASGQGGLGGATAGGILSGGLGELIESFKQSGRGQIADSWVNTGENKQCSPADLERAIGPEVLETLSKQTGLSRDELVTRLCRELPDAVDKYTPQGRLPMEGDFSRA